MSTRPIPSPAPAAPLLIPPALPRTVLWMSQPRCGCHHTGSEPSKAPVLGCSGGLRAAAVQVWLLESPPWAADPGDTPGFVSAMEPQRGFGGGGSTRDWKEPSLPEPGTSPQNNPLGEKRVRAELPGVGWACRITAGFAVMLFQTLPPAPTSKKCWGFLKNSYLSH